MTANSLPTQGSSVVSYDLICFSHLRWDFVYQRPQHLLSRFAKHTRVFFIEEPIFVDGEASLRVSRREGGLFVAVPHFPNGWDQEQIESKQRELLDGMIREQAINEYVCWYSTPMMLPWSEHLDPLAVVYDCMDELSAFKNPPPGLLENEAKLLSRADVVFTGGQSLYEAKKDRHPNVHLFPSSIDASHFRTARSINDEPEDMAGIPRPRLGYCGVIDERLDLDLLAGMANLRPDWQFVMVGPVVKIDEAGLPRRSNIHYPGGKDYKELPRYLGSWDIALMPFALNESTRFISPTKTPEYLAAGRPVISTAIRDVVRPYGDEKLVEIASTAEEFVEAAERILQEGMPEDWLYKVDEFLAARSWDTTWQQMTELIGRVVETRGNRVSAAV